MNGGMYRENILDHYKRPHHRGKMKGATCSGRAINPFCGDDITFYLKVRGKRGEETVEEASFDGKACAICTAAASMLTDEVKGKAAARARSIGKGRVLELLGISPGPMRLKCALLPLDAFRAAIYSFLGRNASVKDDGDG